MTYRALAGYVPLTVLLGSGFVGMAAHSQARSSAPVPAPAIATAATFPPPILVDGGTVGPTAAPTSCQLPVAASSFPSKQVQHLGIHTVGETVTFTVPPLTGTISIVEQTVGAAPQTLLYEGFLAPNGAVPTLLTEPNGTVLYDDTATLPSNLASTHVVDTDGIANTGVMTLPNTTQALVDSSGHGYPAGQWSLQVNDYALECLTLAGCTGGTAADQYDLTVITKRLSHTTGNLDVAVYLATESLTAAGAVSNPSVDRFALTLASLYAQAGIGIDSITFYDLPPWAKALYATGVNATDTGPCSDLGQLFTLSIPGDNINFFFVDAIEPVEGAEQIVGIDGSIPGPASFGGTVTSGAVVNSSDIKLGVCGSTTDFGNCGADETAYIAAHEGGHFMGLYHTTESTGDTFDPLQDTPKCTCSACLTASAATQCVNHQYSKSADVCTQTVGSPCGGGNDLMFWLLEPPISTGVLSPQQGKIMRTNPVVQ